MKSASECLKWLQDINPYDKLNMKNLNVKEYITEITRHMKSLDQKFQVEGGSLEIDPEAMGKAGNYVRHYCQEHPYGNLDELKLLFYRAIIESYEWGFIEGENANDN